MSSAPLMQDRDLYTLLNLSKDASLADIKTAYKQVSRIYHPDKQTDPELSHEAKELFAKIQKAYEILSDPNTKAIYDLYGMEEVQNNLQVSVRSTDPNEIKLRYEYLKKKKEIESLLNSTKSTGIVSCSFNISEFLSAILHPPASESVRKQRPFTELLEKVELTGLSFQQSIQASLTESDTLTFYGGVTTANGNGGGAMTLGYKRDLSEHTWVEASLGTGDKSIAGLKIFHLLNPASYILLSGSFVQGQLFSSYVKKGFEVLFARQLTPSTMGHLSWKVGLSPSMATTVETVFPTSFGNVTSNGQRTSGSNRFDGSSGNSNHSSNNSNYNNGQQLKNKLAATLRFGFRKVSLNASYLYHLASDLLLDLRVRLGLNGITFEYATEAPLSKLTSLRMGVHFGLMEGAILRLQYTRMGQTYVLPIQLSEELDTTIGLLALIVPPTACIIGYLYGLTPYKQAKKQRKIELLREANRQLIKECKEEAESAIKIMRPAVERKAKEEAASNGLVIIKAWYGNFDTDDSSTVINVTLPVQNLVRNSQLVLSSQPKSGLIGFYDCAMGSEKTLQIHYKFKSKLHEVIVSDEEELSCPKRSHLIM